MYADGNVCGVTTSGGYGHHVGRTLAFAHVDPAFTSPGTALSVEILVEQLAAKVLPGPIYNPDNARLKA